MENTWQSHQWEDWIPVEIRKQIKEFWSVDIGRGPKQWKQDEIEQEAPRTGSIVTLPELISKKKVTGRYVHCWNNIGRIVHEDGSFSYVSFYSNWPVEKMRQAE